MIRVLAAALAATFSAAVPGAALAQVDAAPQCPRAPAEASSPPARPPVFAAAATARQALESADFDSAGARLEEARAAGAELPKADERAHVLIHVGRSYLLLAERSPPRRATATLAAVESFQRAAGAAREAGNRRLESYAMGYLGEIYGHEGRTVDAAGLTRRALLAAHQAGAPDAIYRWQWQLGRLHLAAGEKDQALAQYRNALRTLREVHDLLTLQGATAVVAFRRGVAPIYEDLVGLLLERAARTAKAAEKEALLAEARSALEDLKVAELRDYFRDACLADQRRAAPEEVPGAVVIYPVVLADRLELIVSTGGGRFESASVPVDRATLVETVRALRRSLQRVTDRRYEAHSERLYDWLIRPLAPYLAADGPEPGVVLVFVPGGALRTVPLAALRDRETGRFLIEQYPLAVTPGLTLTNPRPIDRGRATLLAAGIDRAVQGYPALDYAGLEIEAVAQAFPSQKLLNDEFAVGRFADEISAKAFGIVHIATHGAFDADASRSFLVAHDAKLSMDELARIVATTRFRKTHPLELLTLSACDTAAGDDLAALGLAGVALQAGARSALATLWSVNDEATAALMSEFYAQLADPGVSRAIALQRAQIGLLSQYLYRHPNYWSPFLLIGSWL